MLLNPRFTRCLIAVLSCVFAVIAAQAQTPKRAAPRAAAPVAEIAPALSDKIIAGATAVRKNGAKTNVLRFGYVMNQRRLPQLWVYGVSISPTGIEPNADAALATLNPQMQALLNERAKMSSRLRLSDLLSRVINLSYIDADGALFALRAMGYSAITDDNPLSSDVSVRHSA